MKDAEMLVEMKTTFSTLGAKYLECFFHASISEQHPSFIRLH
jgi:hypothetical protein